MQTEKQKEWYLKNKELTISRSKKWKKKNPDKLKISAKKYYEKNKENIFARNKIWKKNHYVKKQRGYKNLIGAKFGRLTVSSLNHSTKKGERFWGCICDCGNKKVISGISLMFERTKSCGCLHKDIIQKMCQKRIGGDHPGWKGDNISYSMIHQWLRKNFKKEKCEHCEIDDETLDFALIKNKEHSRNRKSYIILCRKCHIKYDK